MSSTRYGLFKSKEMYERIKGINNMKCFYHNDLDGQCAGAIVYKFENKKCDCIPINYNQKFPFKSILENELIYIVDYSLPIKDFLRLYDITKNIVWIDHHKTAIELAETNSVIKNLPGIRSTEMAGCELTWIYFYTTEEIIPEAVSYIGDYDTWKYRYGTHTESFVYGISLLDTKPESDIWSILLNITKNPTDSYINKVYEIKANGGIIKQYVVEHNKSVISSWGFETVFENHKCIACNASRANSKLFDSVSNKNDYDILITFVFDGTQWTISLYTEKDIDVSEIAKKYGGGGHPHASGFQTKELPFSKK